jgi:hypothetical protein
MAEKNRIGGFKLPAGKIKELKELRKEVVIAEEDNKVFKEIGVDIKTGENLVKSALFKIDKLLDRFG